jgi:hypothetical protein
LSNSWPTTRNTDVVGDHFLNLPATTLPTDAIFWPASR